MLKFSDLAEIMDGQILHLSKDQFISRLLTDSRQLVVHPEALFFAIKGPNHDGHKYLEDVLSQHVSNFVIEQPVVNLPAQFSNANVIAVKDSVKALQALAAYHRSNFDIPVVGITGSNAKTIIKEWLFQLQEDRVMVKSPKSYNSQIGVPLSVWQLNESAEIAIFEAGVSKKGEMEHLAGIIRPDIGIFTNIGTAHDAGFKNVREKVTEKCALFRDSKVIIYRKDHKIVDQVLQQLFPDKVLFGWSTNSGAKINFSLEHLKSATRVTWEGEPSGEIQLPFADHASVENALHCVAFLLQQGYSAESIGRSVRTLRNIPHRLALRAGINNCQLVDDTYNNDLAGLGIALDFLNQQPPGKGKVVILSDIKQASGSEETLYKTVADRITTYRVDQFIGIGNSLKNYQAFFPSSSIFFSTTAEFLSWLSSNQFSNQLILVKGAREFAFENVVQQLLKKHHGTVLEINLDALTNNLNTFKNLIRPETRIMAMVKAFAYGAGNHEIANLLQYHGVDYLGVAYADEGVDLRRHGITLPIMVMNPSPDNFDQFVDYQLEPEIYSLELLRDFQRYCKERKLSHGIHIKLDTGMHRLGFDISDIEMLADHLKEYPLPIISVFSHLAAADVPDQHQFSEEQFEKFVVGADRLEASTETTIIKHILNSAGIEQFPAYQLDMVRLGIGLYGVGNTINLRSVSSLSTTISQIKHLNAGDTVGYGRIGQIKQPSTIATIAIGYADGYDRRFSNGVGKVLVGDKLAPVIGNVCMDMTMIDITHCQAEVGDTVVIFNDQLKIQTLAESIGTIPYELFTKISERVKRVYYLE